MAGLRRGRGCGAGGGAPARRVLARPVRSGSDAASGWQPRRGGVRGLEYRRIGSPGGGWPGTLLDVAGGVDALADLADRGLDQGRVAVVGHSAGGHLALWVRAAHQLAGTRLDGVPVPRLRVRPGFVVSLAGVCDLTEAARRELSREAARELLGGDPAQYPNVTGWPARPGCCRRGYRSWWCTAPWTPTCRTSSGDRYEMLTLPGVEHFALIDPASSAWAAVARRLDAWRSGPARPWPVRHQARAGELGAIPPVIGITG